MKRETVARLAPMQTAYDLSQEAHLRCLTPNPKIAGPSRPGLHPPMPLPGAILPANVLKGPWSDSVRGGAYAQKRRGVLAWFRDSPERGHELSCVSPISWVRGPQVSADSQPLSNIGENEAHLRDRELEWQSGVCEPLNQGAVPPETVRTGLTERRLQARRFGFFMGNVV